MQSVNKVKSFEKKAEAKLTTVLELTVNNHPGVMSHICGLFSRRVYNVEGIVCVPIGTSELSRIRFQINEGAKLTQVVKQLEKLPDVYSIKQLEGDDAFWSSLIEQMEIGKRMSNVSEVA